MVETNPLEFLVMLFWVGLPVYALCLLYKALQELRALRNSVDGLRHAVEREHKSKVEIGAPRREDSVSPDTLPTVTS
jgi:hypothetical protein